MKGRGAALERLPDMEVAPRLMVVALSKCARSSSIDSSGFVFAFRGSVSLPHHLWSICDMCGAFDSPDSASMRPCGLVGPPGAADISRSRFQSSSATWWVRLVGWMYVVNGRWYRRPRYVRHIAFALLVLTRLVFSQRCRTDSFRVVTRTARCAVHSALSPIHLDSIAIAPALPTAFNASRHSSLASMASWPVISTWCIRSDNALAPAAPGVCPIVSSAVDNLCAVRIALDDIRRLLLASMASRGSISTWCVRFIGALVSDHLREFLDIMGTAWYGRFTARLTWLLSRSTR